MEFEEWSNKKKEQDNFAKWAEGKKAAQPVAASYSAPFYGAGDAARLGVERTQPAQPTQPSPVQPEIQMTPSRSRGGITLHPGMEEVDQKAKAAQSQVPPADIKIPETPAQKPYIAPGQATRLGERTDRRQWRKQGGERVAATWDSGLSAAKEQNPLVATGIEPIPSKPFTFWDSPKAEIPANRFSARDVTHLPGFEARTGMSGNSSSAIPSSVNVSPGNLLEAVPLGAYTNKWDIEEAGAPVPSVFATMDDETLSQLITEYSDQMRKLKSQGLSGMLESGMWDNLSEPQKYPKPAMLIEDAHADTGLSGGTPIFASPQPPKKDSKGESARDFGSGGKSLSTLYDTGFMIGTMADLYDEDSYLVNGKELVEDSMKSLAGTFAANDTKLMAVAQDMFDRFINGNGDDYESPILTQKVLEHPNTQNFIRDTMGIVQKYLSRDGGDLAALKSDKDYEDKMRGIRGPNFNTEPDLFGGLTICLNGTWGYTVDIADYKFDGKNYSGTLRYTLYDHFGLDEADISKDNWYKGAYAPFAAWYVLQYYEGCEGKYKPFVTYMNFEVPFSDSID